MALGMGAEEAQQEAEASFGDRMTSRAECLEIDLPAHRRARWQNAWAELVQDSAFAVRALTRNLQSSVAMVAILALGIGPRRQSTASTTQWCYRHCRRPTKVASCGSRTRAQTPATTT